MHALNFGWRCVNLDHEKKSFTTLALSENSKHKTSWFSDDDDNDDDDEKIYVNTTRHLTPTQEHPRLVGAYLGGHVLTFNFKF